MYFLRPTCLEKPFQVVNIIGVHIIGLKGNAKLIVGNPVVKDRIFHPEPEPTDDVENHRHANGAKKYGHFKNDGDKCRQRPVRLSTDYGRPIAFEHDAPTENPRDAYQGREQSSKAKDETDNVQP